MRHGRTIAGILCGCLLIGSCDDGGEALIGPTNESVGGIWNGTDSQTGRPVLAIATESGTLHLIRADLVQYVGTLASLGTTVTGTLDAFAPPGLAFQDGSVHGYGTVTGTIHQRRTLDAAADFVTERGGAFGDTLTLSFAALYYRPSSLDRIAGTFTAAGTGTGYSISGAGAVFAQDATSGCVINGAVTIIDATYNAYGVSLSYASCSGEDAELNGLTLTGLATLDNTGTPEQALVSVAADGSKVARFVVLQRN